ncbi:MAG: peptidase P60 [Candidatus Portnoybacteria bacterium CG10_big_fil_rev_8_21_14_0_10_36_7]|uniref:Peptidase P60 n=1 Tax=Candidatus Portnoybacteria bacterium CG10_big_fil_rev_8_21_14_0_10_36_7 TaxID=1974812 RepID=A0A2M8KER1_9BACT|nr:MAG: peptidase P60 [Candidatus Portnoybacteria bacterium CG10_big_fil_rev_8_21_14_0_10_36_7]
METKVDQLISVAKKNLGKPYKYGAKPADAPKYFDCSSFTQYLFKRVGVVIPRTALEQIDVGKSVSKKNMKPGDLVFCKGSVGRYNRKNPDGVGHVALYIGKNKVIHAKSVEASDGKEKGKTMVQGIENFYKNGWRGAKRIL